MRGNRTPLYANGSFAIVIRTIDNVDHIDFLSFLLNIKREFDEFFPAIFFLQSHKTEFQ